MFLTTTLHWLKEDIQAHASIIFVNNFRFCSFHLERGCLVWDPRAFPLKSHAVELQKEAGTF